MGFFNSSYGKSNFPSTVPNIVKTLTVNNFTSQPDGGFKATINHGLNSNSLVVDAYGEDGKSILGCVTLKDNNTLEIYNEVAVNCTVVINRGNVDLSTYCEIENFTENTIN